MVMKRFLALVLSVSIIASLTACGGSADTNAGSSSASQSSAKAVSSESVDGINDSAWDELESVGNIQTENGILTASITIPAELVGDEMTQEELDANAESSYISAKLNEDGSVTYKLTKQQHKAMLDDFVETMDQSIQEMLDSEDYAFTDIKYNDDYTQFDVTLSTDEVGFAEGFAALAFYVYGGMYGIFSGHTADNITVNYYDSNGNLIDSANSNDTGS